jgi:DNA (cytosine-5)-methyltransferase 1
VRDLGVVALFEDEGPCEASGCTDSSPSSREWLTTPERSALMKRVRRRDTGIEKSVRALLHSFGVRYRTCVESLPGRPDIANVAGRWAIFVHGCYWHSHDDCHLAKVPRTNFAKWSKKMSDNRERDRRKITALEGLGYRVLVVWDCETRSEMLLAGKLASFLAGCGEQAARETFLLSTRMKLVTRTVSSPMGRRTTVVRLVGSSECCKDPGEVFDLCWLRAAETWRAASSRRVVRAADLFCGCGGLTLGAREAAHALGYSFEVRLAVDSDSEAMAVYRANFFPDLVHRGDILDLVDGRLGDPPTPRELANLYDLGDLDIVMAGPPCQGYSDLNNRTRRADPRNALYQRVVRFVEVFRPRSVLIENVPQVRAGVSPYLDETLSKLRALGYHVDSGVLDLARLGVPQHRKRHVVLASLLSLVEVASLAAGDATRPRSLAWAIEDLADEPSANLLTGRPKLSEENGRRIQHLFDNGLYNLPNHLRPRCHRDERHSYVSMYGRLRWDAPAQTITGGFNSPGQGRFVHPDRPRTLTAHEAARLQMFPDSFDFSAAKSRQSLARMIGNAVPMKLSYLAVSRWLAATVASEP